MFLSMKSQDIWRLFLGSEIFDLFICLIWVPSCKVSEMFPGLHPRYDVSIVMNSMLQILGCLRCSGALVIEY